MLALPCDAVSRWVLRILGIGLIGMAATTDDFNPLSDPLGKPIATATSSGSTCGFSRLTWLNIFKGQ
jgi:hypothetical protein